MVSLRMSQLWAGPKVQKPSIDLLKKSVLEIKNIRKLPILVGFGLEHSNRVKEN